MLVTQIPHLRLACMGYYRHDQVHAISNFHLQLA